MSSSKTPRPPKDQAPKDQDIDFSDIPQTDEGFWAQAELRLPRAKGRRKKEGGASNSS